MADAVDSIDTDTTPLPVSTQAGGAILWAVDAQGVITQMEGEGLRSIAVEPNQWQGLLAQELFRDYPQLLDGLRKAQQGIRNQSVVQFKGRHFHTLYTPLTNDSGQPNGVSGFSVDVTACDSKEALERSRRDQQLLSACNQILVRSRSEQQQLQQICDLLVEQGGYPFVWIGASETLEADTVTPYVHAGEAGSYLTDIDEQARGRRLSGECIRNNERLLFYKLDQPNPPLNCLPQTIKSAIALPLVKPEQRVFSVLWIFSEQADAFDDSELKLLSELAEDMTFGLVSHRIRQSLHDNEAMFRVMSEDAMVGVYLIQDDRFSYVNPYLAKTFGYSAEQLVQYQVMDLVAPEDRERVRENLRRRYEGEISSLDYSFTGLRSDGERIQVEVFGSRTELNGLPCVVGTLIDVTERQQMEAQLQLMMRALESSNNGIAITDLNQPDNPYIYVNPAFEQITGYSSIDVVGRNPRFLLNDDLIQPELEKLKQALKERKSVTVTLRNYRRDGRLFWNELSMAPVFNDQGQAGHYVSIINDVTDGKLYEQQLEKLSNYDSLTGLANKNLMADRLGQSIIHAQRNDRGAALVMLDLDRFKMLNQSVGISATDEVLCTIAERIRRVVRPGDTVARLAADDFAVVLHDLHESSDIALVVQGLMNAVSEPLTVGPDGMVLTCSVGIAVYPQDGEDVSGLMRNAEAAQYKAMEQRNSFRFYTPELNERAEDRLALEVSLRQAVEREEFVLYYQPKVDLRSGKITGAEALIRWIHPERGLVPPNEFIPAGEETGLIIQIGAWAMARACRVFHQLNTKHGTDLKIAVNLSAKQFNDENLSMMVAQALSSSGLGAELLECEITESMLMDNPVQAMSVLNELKSLGIGVALDDFGTGYSSLSYLKRFPIDTLKIDRSFVQDIPGDVHDIAISRAIIALAETLELYVVAEGVETDEQREFLKCENCDSMQGFLFSRPVPADEFETLLLNHLSE